MTTFTPADENAVAENPPMPVDRTLARVEADLAAGELALACRRLEGLVTSFPERLDLREQLAEVCRRRGDRVQAGRWSYLAERRDPAEVAAFERSARRPVRRMRALAWVTDPETAATAVARERLTELRDRARRRNRDPGVTYEQLRTAVSPPTDRPTLARRAVVAAAVALLCLAAALSLVGVLAGVWIVLSGIL